MRQDLLQQERQRQQNYEKYQIATWNTTLTGGTVGVWNQLLTSATGGTTTIYPQYTLNGTALTAPTHYITLGTDNVWWYDDVWAAEPVIQNVQDMQQGGQIVAPMPAPMTDLERAAARQAEHVWMSWQGNYWAETLNAAQTEDQRRELQARQTAREVADARALELFLSMLTPEQRAEHDAGRMVTVRSQSSKRRYRIRTAPSTGRHGNILELDERGREVASLCCAPGGDIPHFDAILGQVIALQYDEQAFRRKANFTPRRAA